MSNENASAQVQAQEPEGSQIERALDVFEAAACKSTYDMRGGVQAVINFLAAPVPSVAVPDDDTIWDAIETEEIDLGQLGGDNQLALLEAIKGLFAAPAAQGDAKDAERYRYIRDTGTLDAAVWSALEGYGCADEGDIDQVAYAAGMDQAIDAAIAAKAAS